jgi:hypothetical protein
LNPLLQPVQFVWQACTPRSEKEGNENSDAPFIASAYRYYVLYLYARDSVVGCREGRKMGKKRAVFFKKK